MPSGACDALLMQPRLQPSKDRPPKTRGLAPSCTPRKKRGRMRGGSSERRAKPSTLDPPHTCVEVEGSGGCVPGLEVHVVERVMRET